VFNADEFARNPTKDIYSKTSTPTLTSTAADTETTDTVVPSSKYSKYLEYAPAAASVAQMAYAMKNKPKEYAESRYNIDNPFKASTIDLDPIREDIELGSNTAYQNARATSGGSRASAQVANLEINRSRNKNMSDVNLKEQEINAAEKARVQQGTAEIDRINTMLERGMLDVNEGNRAKYEAYMHYGIGALGENLGGIATNERRDKMVRKTFKYDPDTGEKIKSEEEKKKNGGYLKKRRTKKTN
tara:strand:- start:1543 stop:2274 length:732 start_codon:yes stop_codon:yes gene_type:complete